MQEYALKAQIYKHRTVKPVIYKYADLTISGCHFQSLFASSQLFLDMFLQANCKQVCTKDNLMVYILILRILHINLFI